MTSSNFTPQPDGLTSKTRRIDWFSLLLLFVTIIVLGRTAWIRFAPEPWPEPPRVGQSPPPVKLIDLDTNQPMFLVYPRGQVVWLTFWSSQAPEGVEDLKRFETIWRRFRGRDSFRLLAAAIEDDQAEAIRAMVRDADASLPVVLASEKARRAFGARSLPFHVLIDAKGKVLMVAQGRSAEDIERMAKEVQAILDQIEPAIGPRFA